jgi:hypothetical protein
MVYRAATENSDPALVIENEAGRWEWQIVELEEGYPPPIGWKSLPDVLETVSEPAKTKRTKIKLPTENEPVTEDTDGNSD